MEQLGARDLQLLRFAAEHRFVLPDHVQALLGTTARTARARMRALTSIGALTVEAPSSHLITRKGLGLIDSDLPRPHIDWRCYQHDVGLAWVWLAAHRGVWGSMREIISERRLRSGDAKRDHRERPLAVRLGGTGPAGHDRLHYPDLLLVDAGRQRVAVELELSSKGHRRLGKILAGYGADARFDAVLYLVGDARIAAAVGACARQLGIERRLCLQPVRWSREDRQARSNAVVSRSRAPSQAPLRSAVLGE